MARSNRIERCAAAGSAGWELKNTQLLLLSPFISSCCCVGYFWCEIGHMLSQLSFVCVCMSAACGFVLIHPHTLMPANVERSLTLAAALRVLLPGSGSAHLPAPSPRPLWGTPTPPHTAAVRSEGWPRPGWSSQAASLCVLLSVCPRSQG